MSDGSRASSPTCSDGGSPLLLRERSDTYTNAVNAIAVPAARIPTPDSPAPRRASSPTRLNRAGITNKGYPTHALHSPTPPAAAVAVTLAVQTEAAHAAGREKPTVPKHGITYTNKGKMFARLVRDRSSEFIELAGFLDAKRMFPITTWIHTYDKTKAIGDLIAGVTVGIMLLPQGMAYSSIAGLPPVYGLYSAYMGLIVYCFTGTSKDITTGPTALMSLIVSHSFEKLPKPGFINGTEIEFDNPCSAVIDDTVCCTDGDDYLCTPVNMAIALSFVTGIYQVAMGFLNFGFVIDFIGFPVLNGFTTAAAVTIFTSQIKYILGLSDIRRNFVEALEDIFSKLDQTRYQDVLMGLACILLTVWLEKVKAKYTPRKDDSRRDYIWWLCGTARNSLVIVFAIIIARIVAAVDNDKVFSLIRDVPAGLDSPGYPMSKLKDDEVGVVWQQGVVTAMLGFLESIAIGKAFAQKDGYDLDNTQELRALGLGNLVNSFFQAYPITGSFSRTAVNNASNVQTPMAGLITGAIVVIALYALTPVFFYIPKASLGAIIMMSVVHMVSVEEVKRIARVNPLDLIVWATSFLACLFWSLEFGILLACGVSILFSSINIRQQKLERLKKDYTYDIWVPDDVYHTRGLGPSWAPHFIEGVTNNFIVIKCTGSLEFVATSVFKDRISYITKYLLNEDHVMSVVIDMSSVPKVDYTGVQALEYALKEMRPGVRKIQTVDENGKRVTIRKRMRGIRLHLAHMQGPVLRTLKKALLFGAQHRHGNMLMGEWKASHHATIDYAVKDLGGESEEAEDNFPFSWMAPDKKPIYEDVDANAIGQDDKTWVIKLDDNKKKIWTRLKLGPAIFKSTEC